MADFSDWLEHQLKLKGMKPIDLARKSGLDTGYLSRILNRERKPGAETYVAIAQGLDLPEETVFRAAGLLPPKPDDEVTLEEWRYVLEQLSEEDREELLNIARLKIERRENKKKQSTTHRNAEGLA